MKKMLLLGGIFAILFLVGCKKTEQQPIDDNTEAPVEAEHSVPESTEIPEVKLNEEPAKTEDVTAKFPDFEINLKLSNAALKKLTESKESVIASVYLYGDVDENEIPAEMKSRIDPTGFSLGTFDFEKTDLSQNTIFEIRNLTFPKAYYDVLSNKDIHYNINIYSGRKSSEDNLIRALSAEGNLSDLTETGNKIKMEADLL
ncbi:MAG: hypothetical protein WDA08_12145 [Weeksellaceae bacterium]